MRNKVDTCVKCNKKSVIMNVRHYLCYDCNKSRLTGKSKYELNQELIDKRNKALQERSFKMMRNSMLKATSNNTVDGKICSTDRCTEKVYTTKRGKAVCRKCMWVLKKEKLKFEKRKPTSQNKRGSSIKSQMSEIKKISKLKAIEEGNNCEGCKKASSSVLDYSHILSVAQRKDLELDNNNKNMLCRTCHEKWESNDPQKMLSLACFYDNMTYIYKNDSKRFYNIYFMFNDAMMFEECKELEGIENDNKK